MVRLLTMSIMIKCTVTRKGFREATMSGDRGLGECLKEDLGTGRYGCRCQACCEGVFEQVEVRDER